MVIQVAIIPSNEILALWIKTIGTVFKYCFVYLFHIYHLAYKINIKTPQNLQENKSIFKNLSRFSNKSMASSGRCADFWSVALWVLYDDIWRTFGNLATAAWFRFSQWTNRLRNVPMVHAPTTQQVQLNKAASK